MAYSLLFSERPTVAASSPAPTNPLRALAGWIAEICARRAQRAALVSLLDFDTALLDDLGISRQDVIDALNRPPVQAGRHLSLRRAQVSRDWLSQP